MDDNKEKLLNAFIENPTTFKVNVSDSSMLPDGMKDKKTVDFVIKPPVLAVLALCATVMAHIPPEVRNPDKQIKLSIAIKYLNQMAESFAIISHGKTTPYPEWYVPFLINNVTPKELFYMFTEAALKTQSSFFLNSIQVADETNPMMMHKPKVKK